MRQLWFAVPAVFALAAAAADPAHAQAGAAECSVASLQAKAPAGTTITAASVVAAAGNLPQHCRVDGTVATPGNSVTFRLALPAAWNNKFYFQGVGGFAGSVGSLQPGLTKGYASASTDTGHQGAATDASWAVNNPAKEIDYGHRGTHVATVATKALTQAYYGSAPRYAYFEGCSNGGRQALMEAQRYPEDFDGIIAGNPSMGTGGYVRRALNYQQMLSSPERVLPASKLKILSQAVMASCDGRDGLVDGLISDPRACSDFRPETLKCAGPDGADCLTAGQLETVKMIYADIKTPSGGVLAGTPVGHEDGATGWQQWISGATAPAPGANGALAFGAAAPLGFRFQDGYFKYLAFEQDDPNFDVRTLDLQRDWARIEARASIFSPTSTDLSGLQTRGGKLLLYHGWADPGISAYATLRYYEDVVKAAGGKEKSDPFVRLFMPPGMHHCMPNGPGFNTFDALTALENWVEKGVAPASVLGMRVASGTVNATRPICAYPLVARYSGTGNVNDAANFRCDAPAAQGSAGSGAEAPALRTAVAPVRGTTTVQSPPGAAARSAEALASATTYKVPRTPWGDPDLQGTYTNKYETSTPFERPREFEGRRLEDVTQEELVAAVRKRQQDTLARAKFFGGDPEGRIGNSAEFRDIYEIERGSRPWFVVDPADGQIPAILPEAKARIAAQPRAGGSFGNGPFNSAEDFSLWDRCITRGFPASMLPGQYGNSYEIVQGPGVVAIRYEMVHDTRVIPLDRRPHVSSRIASDMGDARGYWDGDTLVVETTNFRARSAYRNANAETLKIVERFRRTAADKVEWSVTVEDPKTWARPWTFAVPLTMNDREPVFEYACHEGNHAIRNILSAARTAEAGTGRATEGASR